MGVILNNLIPIIGSSIAMSIPLVLASVGGAFSVRSGIMAPVSYTHLTLPTT